MIRGQVRRRGYQRGGRGRLALGLGLALLFLAGLAAAPARGADRTVSMGDNTFVPETLTITVGDRVIWRNDGAVAHNAAATAGSVLWTPQIMWPGDVSAPRTFNTVGTFEYFCQFHPAEQRGRIVVVAAPTPTPTPVPAQAPPAQASPAAGGTADVVAATPAPPAAGAPATDIAPAPTDRPGPAPGFAVLFVVALAGLLLVGWPQARRRSPAATEGSSLGAREQEEEIG